MTPIIFPHQQFLEQNKEIIAQHPLPNLLKKRILGFDELQEDLQYTTDEDRAKLLKKLEALSEELDEDLEEYFEPVLENNDEEEDEEPEQDQHSEEITSHLPEAETQTEEPPVVEETEHSINPENIETEMKTDTTETKATEQEQQTTENPAEETSERETNTEQEAASGGELEREARTDDEPAQETPDRENEPEQETPAEEEQVEQEVKPEEETQPETEAEEQLVLEPSNEGILEELVNAKQTVVHPSELRKKGFKGLLGHRTVPVGKFTLHRGKYDTCYKILPNT